MCVSRDLCVRGHVPWDTRQVCSEGCEQRVWDCCIQLPAAHWTASLHACTGCQWCLVCLAVALMCVLCGRVHCWSAAAVMMEADELLEVPVLGGLVKVGVLVCAWAPPHTALLMCGPWRSRQHSHRAFPCTHPMSGVLIPDPDCLHPASALTRPLTSSQKKPTSVPRLHCSGLTQTWTPLRRPCPSHASQGWACPRLCRCPTCSGCTSRCVCRVCAGRGGTAKSPSVVACSGVLFAAYATHVPCTHPIPFLL